MAEEAEAPEDDSGGAPAWVMTFADLMSLLMCFFVLLLSFSEMDVQKYKQVAGSMKFAFGVQREVKANEKVKGTSFIQQEYSPGKPQQTLEKIMRQQTTDETKENIEHLKGMSEDGEDENAVGVGKGPEKVEGEGHGPEEEEGEGQGPEADDARELALEQIKRLLVALREEIINGDVEIETEHDMPLIKIQERRAFQSGSAELDPTFEPVLVKIASTLVDPNSHMIVSGHTDDRPINTPRFPSNWVLSAARASSVVHALQETAALRPEQLEIRGYADTVPVAPNDSAENRAKNRRVEILIGSPNQAPDPEQRQPIKIPRFVLNNLDF